MLPPSAIDLGNPVSDHPLNYGLVAWWLPLSNNRGGSKLFDIKGGYHGVFTGGPTWASALNGFAGLTVGTGTAYAQTPLTLPAAPITISFWASSTNGWLDCRPFGAADRNGGIYGLCVLWNYPGDYLYMVARQGSNTGAYDLHVAAPNLSGGPRHVVMTVGPGGLTGYYRGKRVGNNPATTTYTTGGVQLRWGLDHGGAAAGFGGSIWDMRVYSRALSDAEVFRLYEQGLKGHPDTLRRYAHKTRAFVGQVAGVSHEGAMGATCRALSACGAHRLAAGSSGPGAQAAISLAPAVAHSAGSHVAAVCRQSGAAGLLATSNVAMPSACQTSLSPAAVLVASADFSVAVGRAISAVLRPSASQTNSVVLQAVASCRIDANARSFVGVDDKVSLHGQLSVVGHQVTASAASVGATSGVIKSSPSGLILSALLASAGVRGVSGVLLGAATATAVGSGRIVAGGAARSSMELVVVWDANTLEAEVIPREVFEADLRLSPRLRSDLLLGRICAVVLRLDEVLAEDLTI